jgi:type II secretory pathway pseudopilin PulG
MNHLQTSAAKRGFTLVELIVAMAITIIIVGVLVSVTSIATDTWNRSRSELRASRQAKSMVDAMVRDFEALVVRSGNANEWLSAMVDDKIPKGEGSSIDIDLESANAAKLMFFTAATDRYDGKIATAADLGGDVSCVAYHLDYKNPLDGDIKDFKTFVLNRMLINPDETFDKFLGEADSLTKALGSPTQKGSLEEDISNPVNLICENIYQFTVTFHVEVVIKEDGQDVITVIVPVTLGSKTKKLRILGNKIDTDYTGETKADALVSSGRIKAMDVSITVLSDMGIDQLRRRKFSDKDKQAEFLAKHSYQYSKLVQLPSM